jgi:hypothetical protein
MTASPWSRPAANSCCASGKTNSAALSGRNGACPRLGAAPRSKQPEPFTSNQLSIRQCRLNVGGVMVIRSAE